MSTHPAPRYIRFDGWTSTRRAAFLAVFGEGASVTVAAAAVQMSVASLNALRRRDAGFREDFSAACAAREARRVAEMADVNKRRKREAGAFSAGSAIC
jgi:hypothetical protein